MLSDYSELITEASHRTGVTDVASRAKMYVGMAESALSKRLRVAEMEEIALLTTDDTGSVDLPSDYVTARAVFLGKAELVRKTLTQIKKDGTRGYVIQGNKFVSSETKTKHSLAYYAAIPSLEENNTNWLLDREPELYLQAVIFQIYTAAFELEKAQETAAYLKFLLQLVATGDHASRYAGMKISSPSGPV